MTCTRKMLGAAHDVLLKRGLMLSGEMLEEIYLAMDALANHAETSASLPATDHREVMQKALAVLTDINEISKPPMGIALPAEIDAVMDALKEALK